jgi:hypothetical protein
MGKDGLTCATLRTSSGTRKGTTMALQDMRDQLTSDLQQAAILAKRIAELDALGAYFEQNDDGGAYYTNIYKYLVSAQKSAQQIYDNLMTKIGRQLVEVDKEERWYERDRT